jgi:signal transduction histidine kinase
LAVAEAEGRIGVAQSITGRLRDLGGSAVLTTSPGAGTEIELRLGRDAE